MARLITYCGLIVSALLLQLNVLDTLSFPGGVAPDLVLLVVVAIALTGGPLVGLASGFSAGLALDLAPPVAHAVGTYALVFCLIGYVCGQASGELDRSALLPLGAMAFGAVTGSLAYTVVGVMFGEPDVSWAAARRVLPLSVTYDILLSPFVLYLIMRLVRWAEHGAEDPAAALVRSGATQALRDRRPPPPREPRIRPGTSGWIGAGPAARMLAAAGRSPSESALTATGRSWRRALQAGPSRLRSRTARTTAAPAARPGVFSGGSVVGESAVRLRLRGRQPGQIGFGQGRLARLTWLTRLFAQAQPGKAPRFGRPRFGRTRFGRQPFRWPRMRQPRFGRRRLPGARSLAGPRRVIWRQGERRRGGLR